MATTVIVKVGTNTLVDEAGGVRKGVVRDILTSIQDAAGRGISIVLVTSGAVRLGSISTGDVNLNRSTAASIGEPILFRHYASEAEKLHILLAEFLLTRSSLVQRQEFSGLQKTFEDLFARGIIPVVNENDALVADIGGSFGDNDSLASALAIALHAEELVIVSHIDGLFDRDPAKEHGAKLIGIVNDVNNELFKFSSRGVSTGGRGGVLSKLKAARLCTAVGIKTCIVNGLVSGNLARILSGEAVGTTFTPRPFTKALTARDRWLLAAKNSAGSLLIDDGAVSALRNSKSLLAVGVRGVYGEFQAKEIIEVVDGMRRGIAFGIVDYSREEIEAMLREGTTSGKQLIHANNMIVLE